MKNEMKRYESYLAEEELSEETVKIYLRHVSEINKYLEGKTDITKGEILAYKKYLKQKKLAPATLNLAIISVNKYLKYAGYGECIIKTEKIQKGRSLENVINEEEYRSMLKEARKSGRQKYYYIMKTLAQTGIRISELQYFTVEILQEKKIRVQNKGKIREIYLPDGLIQELYHYCLEKEITDGVIFQGNGKQPISRGAVYKMLVRIGKEAGVEKHKAHPHSFRHLFAVTYMSRYGNLAELADILGHSNLETTRIYTATTVEEKRKRMNLMGL